MPWPTEGGNEEDGSKRVDKDTIYGTIDSMHTNDPTKRHSGNVRLRMPIELHDALAQLAHEQRVSLNQLMVALLSSGASWRSDREREPVPSGA